MTPAGRFPSKASAAALCFLLSACVWIHSQMRVHAAQTAARPNIVIILSDDMGYSDLGCFGSEIQTPNLDRMAARGLRFTQFYNTARCCPTRASLLTGLYPHQAGVGHMMEDRGLPAYSGNLNRSCVTIAEVLKPTGYRTYAVGKWHVTRHTGENSPKDNWPLQRGFDRYYGTIHGAGSYWDPSTLTRDNRVITSVSDPEYRPARYYYTDAISDHAVRFVTDHAREHKAQPFFMYVAYTAAHWPLHAKETDIAKYRGKYKEGYEPIRKARFEKQKQLGLIPGEWELSPSAGSWDEVAHRDWEARCMEVYAAQIDSMDQGIGKLFAALDDTGQLQNTLVFFLQDNGACAETTGRSGNVARGEKPSLAPLNSDTVQLGSQPKQTRDGWPVLTGPAVMPGPPDTYVAYGKAWANVSNTPFREYKHWVHEGGIATPLIVFWPARIPSRGAARNQPGHLIDLMATCVEAAGAQYPTTFKGTAITPMEGRSLLPAFDGKPVDRDALFWEHEGNRAVRMGKYKLVAKGPAGPWELYDLEADRTEMNDLAAREPARVQRMALEWETYARRTGALPWIWKPAYGETNETAAAGRASSQRDFRLKANARLSGDDRPNIAGRGFELEVNLSKPGPDGVLVAQGGSAQGFSFFFKEGTLNFALRRDGELHILNAKAERLRSALSLRVIFRADGSVRMLAGSEELATGKFPGPITKLPADGLQVGCDLRGAVGAYQAPFPFSGEIDSARLTLDK